MKLNLNSVAAACLMLAAFSGKVSAQAPEGRFLPDPIVYTVFSADSLRGFDEAAARANAISENYLGQEFKVRMYQLRRQYINNKYNLWAKPTPASAKAKSLAWNPPLAKGAVSAGCVNEDFEASTAGPITTANQIAGWTVQSGYNGAVPAAPSTNTLSQYFPQGLLGAPNSSSVNSCNLLGCCPMPPNECELISVPLTGYIDQIINPGPGNPLCPTGNPIYPIFSVFGSGGANALAAAANTHIAQPMFGNNIIRINSSNNNYSMVKLSKTFSVSAANALFQFAFISVFSTGHSCCDAGAFQIKLTNATTSQPITCPSFSASALSSQCSNTNTGIDFFNTCTGTPASTSSSYIFNKWKIASMDLSGYINQNITIDIITSDCTAGGHFGYVYFDAQCGPMAVIGNNVSFPAGSGTVTVPTCGATTATICGTPGLGPYAWAGPNIPPGYAVPSYTNECFVTNISGTYTLSMNPPGSCVPITRIVNSTITPAPALTPSVAQASCGGTIATVTVVPGGSATNTANVTWSPAPQTLNSSNRVATYVIPPGPAPAIVTITAVDPVGCVVSTTAQIDPAPPTPTFQLNTIGSSFSITCANPTVSLLASSNYSYNNTTLSYFWAGSAQTATATSIDVTTPQTFTVNGFDPVTNCSTNQTISVFANTVHPTSTLNYTFQTINCTNSPSVVVLNATSPTINVSHTILDPLGGTYTASGITVNNYVPSAGPGVYTCQTIDNVNGCGVTKQFTLQTTTGFPICNPLTSSPANFTLGCTTKSFVSVHIDQAQTTTVDINGNQVPLGGPVSYSILAPGGPTVLPSFPTLLGNNSTPTVSIAGTWTVVIRDNNNGCDTRIPVTIVANTAGPAVDSIYISTDILTCNTPSIVLKALNMTVPTAYNWAEDALTNVITNTIVAKANFSAATTSSLVHTYTLTLTNTVSTCKTTSLYPIYQNLYPPKTAIASVEKDLSCKTTSITLTNNSDVGQPAGSAFPTGVALGVLWKGPTPQVPLEFSSTYVGQVPGDYTLTTKDSRNGCTSTATINLADRRVFPLESLTQTVTTLDCGGKDTVKTSMTPAGEPYSYTWTPPAPAEGSTVFIAISDPSKKNLVVSEPGTYEVLVNNTKSGCYSSFKKKVIASNNINSAFEPDQVTGFAPLTVKFENKSFTSSGSASISSVWNFGNGTSTTFSSVAGSPTAVYNQPGTYTVTLFTRKGNCVGSTKKIITVDIPSSLTIPNVFTPNGDNINDLFFLKTTNLTHIEFVVYDRWGHKVYELKGSTTGNVAWDGKNLYGKDSPEGTYFYVLRAVGKDDAEYKDKGTINLFR